MSNVIEVSSLQKQKTEVQYYSGFPALANISIRVAIMVGCYGAMHGAAK